MTVGTGLVSVESGGVLELRSGILNVGAVVIQNNGRLLGNGAINGSLNLGNSATWTFEIGGLVPNTGYDQVAVSGTMNLAGTLDVRFKNGFQSSVTNAQTFTLATSGGTILGGFKNAASGGRFATGDAFGTFLGDYSGPNLQLSAFQAGAEAPPLAGTLESRALTYTIRETSEGVRAFSSRNGRVAAVFGPDGTRRLSIGDGIPGLEGAIIAKLGVPSGDAMLATLKLNRAAGITAANDTILLAGLKEGNLRVAAREGMELATQPGVVLKAFGAIDGHGTDIFFRAILHGSAVTAGGNAALCAALADGGVRTLIREGQVVGTRTVATISTLLGAAGTLAEGRWRAGDQTIGVRLTFSDKTQTLYTIPTSASDPQQWQAWVSSGEVLGPPLAGASITGFGLPGFASAGPAFVTFLETDTPRDRAALLRGASAGLTLLTREGAAAPGTEGAKFQAFSDPVSGSDGRTAFAAQLAGVPRAIASGLWYAADGATLALLARVGDAAPGGGVWASFQSLALPDGPRSGPIFTAKLATDHRAGISAANDLGLWVVDSDGILQRAFITGQTLELAGTARTVKSFTALLPGAGSIGATYGYDATGHIAVQATFTDRTSAVIEITIP